MIYTGPTGGAIRSSSRASALKCSRNAGQTVHWVQAMECYGISANDPSLAWIAMPTRKVENLTYWDLTGTPSQTNGGAASFYGDLSALPPPQPGYWAPGGFFDVNYVWSWRATSFFAWPAQINKLKITGPCTGTLLHYPVIGYPSEWIESLNTPDPFPSPGVWSGGVTYNPSSATYIELAPGSVLEFWPTAAPAAIDGDGIGWIGQACFRFNKHPSDFGM